MLVWWLRDRFDRTALPPGRTVVEVCLTDVGRGYWLLLHQDAVDMCIADPGLPVDVVVGASAAELYRVVQGWRPLDRALRAGLVVLTGPTALTRAFPRWFATPVALPEVVA